MKHISEVLLMLEEKYSYENRKVARKNPNEETGELGLSTVLVPGITPEFEYFETAILSPRGDFGVVVVQRYETNTAAIKGHNNWLSVLDQVNCVLDIEGNVINLKGNH